MKKAALFLVAILIFVGVLFLGRLQGSNRDAVLTASEGSWEYRLGQYPVRVKLPLTTHVVSEVPGGGEMIFSAFLKDDELGFKGYLQLWKVEDLGRFIAASRERSPFCFKDFDQEPVRIKNYEGFQIEWKAVMKDSKPASGKDYLLKKGSGDEALRLSFFSEASSFSPKLSEVVDAVVSSVEWK
ncbi:MAG: hypothetical protein ACPLTR_01770 [Thermacetogeniaceae bacterium]